MNEFCGTGHLSRRGSHGQCLDCQKLRTQRWREANREEDRRRKRVYRAANPTQKAAESKRWWEKNRELKRQYRRNRKALERGGRGRHTEDDVNHILRMQRGRCAYCRKKLGDAYQVDHIIALAQGGSNDRSNLQLVCRPCNRRKWDRHPLEFARSCGMLL